MKHNRSPAQGGISQGLRGLGLEALCYAGPLRAYATTFCGSGLPPFDASTQAKEDVAKHLVTATYEPSKVKLIREQFRVFSDENLALICVKSGADVKLLQTYNDPCLVITGDD